MAMDLAQLKVADFKGTMANHDPSYRKLFTFTAMLIVGLLMSQVSAVAMDSRTHQVWTKFIEQLTMLCLSFIMIGVGHEFVIDKKDMGRYAKDYVVAMTAAGLPWLLVAGWFCWALPGPIHFGSALITARFAAPTSAGILFSMLEAAGLKETWLFEKAQILAILDDLDTIILMIPLKTLIHGFKWEAMVDIVVVFALLAITYRKMHEVRLPLTWNWRFLYAGLVSIACEGIFYVTEHHTPLEAVRVEVLLPSFCLGCLSCLDGHDDVSSDNESPTRRSSQRKTEEQVLSFVSGCFMLLVGLSMPSLFHSRSSLDIPSVIFHVIIVTLLMIIGKMFLLCCYTDEADFRTRLGLGLGMCPRGEVGAGIIVISLNLGVQGALITVSVISLAVNLVLSTGFIMAVQHLATPPKEAPRPVALSKKYSRPGTVALVVALSAVVLGLYLHHSSSPSGVFSTFLHRDSRWNSRPSRIDSSISDTWVTEVAALLLTSLRLQPLH